MMASTLMARTGRPGVAAIFAQALSVMMANTARVGGDRVPAGQSSMAIAYSGGLDSTVLLHLACDYARKHNIVLHAFHIHHGLSEDANTWLEHCAANAAALGIAFDSHRITVSIDSPDGIESSARTGRYAALGALCRKHGVPLLLTGHHQDDQAETVLLQLLRGSGVAGLSGMDQSNHAPTLLGDAICLMGRPLLAVGRSDLQAFINTGAFAHIDDASNQDARYARNALRHGVMPVLEAGFPGFAERFARSAHHAQSAQTLLIELAKEDFARCAQGDGIAIDQIRSLSVARCENLLRYWFASRDMRMPSAAWLQEMRHQVLDAKADAQILVGHGDCDIHRHRNGIFMTARATKPYAEQIPEPFKWDNKPAMHFPEFGGTLYFDNGQPGVASDWLRQQTLAIQWRSGGWRLKLAANRCTRSLKYHYQAADVPAWQRARLPLITVGKHLLYAAGIGMDCQHFRNNDEAGIVLRWQSDSRDLSNNFCALEKPV